MLRAATILLLLFLTSCTSYTVASLSSNVVTYTATGKINSDHAISYVTGKDCKVMRVVEGKPICSHNNSSIVLADNSVEKEKTYKKIINDAIETTYDLTKNVVKDHVRLGKIVTNKFIESTETLNKQALLKYESIKINQVPEIEEENSFNQENIEEKNSFNQENKDELKKGPWFERMNEIKNKRNQDKKYKERILDKKYKERILKNFKKIKLYETSTNISVN